LREEPVPVAEQDGESIEHLDFFEIEFFIMLEITRRDDQLASSSTSSLNGSPQGGGKHDGIL